MKQTFGMLISLCQKNAGNDTSTPAQTFFKERINAQEEFVLSKLPSRYSEVPRSFSTVADRQYYHMPPRMRKVQSITLTVNGRDYVLTPVHSQREWDTLNALDFQGGAIPTRFFERQRDFGIWPIPQEVYTGVITYNLRAGGMTRSDYTTGTVTVAENDQTATGSGTSWNSTTNVVPDMWFTLATSGLPRGSFYQISSITDNTNLELETFFEETGESGASYIIGECPLLPDDLHELLAWGATADYFASFRQDLEKAQMWMNRFWTGDFTKETRDPKLVAGGLLDGIKRYQDRTDSQLIQRKTTPKASDKVWATVLSDPT